jgi:hypothetical protein
MNLTSLNDPNLTLDISDLAEFRALFGATVAETANNIHILHNHNVWWVVPLNFICTKEMPHVTI